MAVKTCGLPECNNPCADSPPHRLACGEFHHLLLMAGRFNPSLPHPHRLIIQRNALGLCALPSCSRSPRHPHPWCSRNHCCSWLFDFYSKLSPQQICKLQPECTRHVFVPDSTDGGRPSEFCGWRHCQRFEMRKALKVQQYSESPQTQESHGHVSSIESLLHDLERFALHGVFPKNVNVADHFFDKHPCDILGEADTCRVIARCKRTKTNQRTRVTEDHYRWRQTGSPKKKGWYTITHFTFEKCKGKYKDAVEHNEGSLYTMIEYCVNGCESYCLVQLRKGVSRRHKGEVDNGFSQDNVLPQPDVWDFEFPDLSEELVPLDSIESIIMQDLLDLPDLPDLPSEDFSP